MLIYLQINWIQLIQTEFKNVGITVYDNDNVIVRNLQYFKALAKMFGSKRNSEIGTNRVFNCTLHFSKF